jgi:predicted nucleic acid-binding protein
MTFPQIPANEAVFIDANILIYYFTPDPTFGLACQQLMDRIAQQEVFAYTSTHVVHDVGHRLMTIEAMAAPTTAKPDRGSEVEPVSSGLRRDSASGN